jgi:hypothetical protein
LCQLRVFNRQKRRVASVWNTLALALAVALVIKGVTSCLVLLGSKKNKNNNLNQPKDHPSRSTPIIAVIPTLISVNFTVNTEQLGNLKETDFAALWTSRVEDDDFCAKGRTT